MRRITIAGIGLISGALILAPLAPAQAAQPASTDSLIASAMSTLHIQQEAPAGVITQAGSRFSVDFAKAGKSLTVTVPGKADAAPSLTAAGRRALASSHVTNVAAAIDGGAQFFTVIKDSSAPTDYAYGASLTGGSTLKVSPAGAALISADKQLGVAIAPAWAVDATGKPVPTHYVDRGGKLVQVVDHTSGAFTYPIVADPTFNWRFFGGEVIFSMHETAAIAAGAGGAAASILGGCEWIPVANIACGAFAVMLGLHAAYFAAMLAGNHCGKVYVYPIPPYYAIAPGGQKRGDIGCR